MAKDRHILHAAARRRGNSSRAAVLIAALAVLAGATAAVQPAQAQTTVDICERTPDVEEAILASPDVTEPNCMIIPQAQLDTVLQLFIATASTTLKSGDFANLPNLEELNISFNDLISLPEGLFDGLSNLEELDMGFNDLISLPEGLFDGLSNLQRLFLNSNNLTSVPAGLFDDLSNLEALIIDFNDLILLPEGLFDGLSNLQRLSLDSNSLTSVPAGLFDDLSNLEALGMGFNDLTSLPEGLFDGLSNLQRLFLDSNSLTSVPAGLFDDLSNLEELLLDDNFLTSLPAGLFDDLSNLEALNMSFNDLISLDENLFDDLSNLKELNMGFNDLISLPEGLFDDLSNLEELDMNFNDLISLPEGLFDGLSALQILLLDTNGLTSLDENLFDGLSALTRLTLNNNNLTSLPTGIFNDVLDTLTDLTLDNQGNDNANLRSTVSIEPSTAVIGSNAAQTFTARLAPPSPATVRLTIIAGGDQASHVTLPDPATVTIPAGMTSADFDITLTGATEGNTGIVALSTPVLIYTDTNGEEQENTAVVGSLVNASAATSTFTVADPSATYDLIAPGRAFEPTSTTDTNTTMATFTITLNNLNGQQMGSNSRRFFFRFASSSTGTGNSLTPGYGSLDPSIQDDARADPGDDFDFILEYESLNGSDEMIVFSTGSQGYSNPDSDGQIDRAARVRGREIYTFLIIPKHDDIDDEGLEHVVFGYRVFFGGLTPDGAHPLTGVVNGGTGDPAATIQEGSDAIRLRIRTFLEGALQ